MNIVLLVHSIVTSYYDKMYRNVPSSIYKIMNIRICLYSIVPKKNNFFYNLNQNKFNHNSFKINHFFECLKIIKSFA